MAPYDVVAGGSVSCALAASNEYVLLQPGPRRGLAFDRQGAGGKNGCIFKDRPLACDP
jgi:hypothetical protein